jgi:hypothetical protein
MRTSFHHQSEAQPPNGPLTAATSPDTPSTTPATQFVSASGNTPIPSLVASFRPAILDRDGATLDPAEFAQPLHKRGGPFRTWIIAALMLGGMHAHALLPVSVGIHPLNGPGERYNAKNCG